MPAVPFPLGVLSLPFFVFTIPIVSNVLLHVRGTGYNRAGQCVPVIYTSKEAKQKEKQDSTANAAGPSEVVVVPISRVCKGPAEAAAAPSAAINALSK